MERREKPFRSAIFVLFIIFSLWVILQFLAPLMLPAGSIQDISGAVAVSDNDYVTENMSFPWNFIYNSGDRLCHQIAERSFFINGNQMPFCARCTAIWLGLAIGLGFMVFYKIQLDEKFLFAIIICLVPIGIDGVGQLFGLWESTNIVRLITGLLAGGICGLAIGIIIDETKEIIFIKNKN